MSSFKLITKAS